MLPKKPDDLLRVMAERVVRVTVPESGQLAISPLPAGSYEVFRRRVASGKLVEVTGPGSRVVLDCVLLRSH